MVEEKNKSVTPDELRLILFWRHRCHENEDKTRPCPMKCHQEGIDLCHDISLKFVEWFAEDPEVQEKKPIEKALNSKEEK